HQCHSAAAIVNILLLLHSVVDYPLRTAVLSMEFAIACALLTASRKIEPVGSPAHADYSHECYIENPAAMDSIKNINPL
ncbi:MAG: hypothetical protein ACREQE_08035, partial [Candidatus Binataceae bacterium]